LPVPSYYIDSGAAIITLEDSEHGNRLTRDLLEALQGRLQQAFEDDTVRVVVLRSDGPAFCFGMDLDSFEKQRGSKQVSREASVLYGNLLKTVFTGRKPVVTVLRGPVKAGGVGLVAASDIVLATPEVSFQLSEVLFGLIPANVLPYLLGLRMPASKARYLVLTAKEVGPDEALRFGLVDEIITSEKLEKETKKICKTLFRASPAALRETKEFTAKLVTMELNDRFQFAQEKLEHLLSDEEIGRAVAAFREGELPVWFQSFRPENPLTKPDEAGSSSK
jgi:enoyl-CoA hydratase/carnithine racemase